MLDVELEFEPSHPRLEEALDALTDGYPRTYTPPLYLRQKLVPEYACTPDRILIVSLNSLMPSYFISNWGTGYLDMKEKLDSYPLVELKKHFKYSITYATDFIQFDYLRYFTDILVVWRADNEINCLSLLKMLNNEHRSFFGNKEIRREHNAWRLIKGALSAKEE